MTKYLTHREDIQREWTLEEYTKEHYDSWVAFARETGHGNGIKPILVTGVDMTRDFAMISYSNDSDDGDLIAEFTTSDPGASTWGTWQTTGAVYTDCGPQPCSPSVPAQTAGSVFTGSGHRETVSDESNQCVFVRYYTVRKRLGIPKIIRAAVGPHDLGPGGRDDKESPVGVQFDSDSSSDVASSPSDDDTSSATSIDSKSDIVIHNTNPVRSLPSVSAPPPCPD